MIVASNNKGKIEEIKSILNRDIYSLKDKNINIDIEENGKTFIENATIKAKAIYELTHEEVIADDSGLSIRALNNEPGIYSARYMEGHDYPEKNRNLIERLKDSDDRYAWFTCAIALIDHNGAPHVFEGIMEGEIAFEPAGSNGFGYDPIFMLPELGKTSAQLKPEEKNAISHRGQATRKLIAYLKEEYGNE